MSTLIEPDRPPTREWLTPSQAAIEAGCSAPTIRRLVNDGTIPGAYRLGPKGAIRIDKRVFLAWLEAPEEAEASRCPA